MCPSFSKDTSQPSTAVSCRGQRFEFTVCKQKEAQSQKIQTFVPCRTTQRQQVTLATAAAEETPHVPASILGFRKLVMLKGGKKNKNFPLPG